MGNILENLGKDLHGVESFDEMFSIDGDGDGDHTEKQVVFDFKKVNEKYFLPPQNGEGSHLILYGTKYMYLFIRLFYTLYERLIKAHEISKSFEDNKKCASLSESEKSEMAAKRYDTFKVILLHFFKHKDTTQFEDFLRSLFGDYSFLFFTIDKLIGQTSKILSNFVSDDLSKKLLDKYIDI